MSDYKKKLDVLRHKINTAKRIESYMEKAEERKPEKPEKQEEPNKDINKGISARELREKSLIQAVAGMPAYKSSSYYQLKLISQSIKNLEKAGIKYNPLLQQRTIKLAKNRMKEMIVRLSKKND